MPALKIGRIGEDVPIEWIDSWRIDSDRRGVRERIRFEVTTDTEAKFEAIRHELGALEATPLTPITFDTDDSRDGYFAIGGVRVEVDPSSYADTNRWHLRGDLDATRIGGPSQTDIRSRIGGTVRENAKNLAANAVDYAWSPAIGALATSIPNESPTGHTRATEEGTIPVLIGVDPDGLGPRWRCAPSNYLKGGCYVKVGGFYRSSLSYPGIAPEAWEIGNRILTVTPGLTAGGASNGRIIVSHWDGAAYDSKTYRVLYNGVTEVNEWHFMELVRVDAERVRIKLVRDAEEVPATTHRHELYLQLRRGMLFVEGEYDYDESDAGWKVELVTPEAASNVTPGAASAPVAITASGDDGNGHRFVLGSNMDFTSDLLDGGITFAATDHFSFFIGSVVNFASAVNLDLADDQCLQYMGALGEYVRGVRVG